MNWIHCRFVLLLPMLAVPLYAMGADLETPISTDGFKDGIKHYRDGTGQSDYARFEEGNFEEIARNILLHQRDNGGWPPNFDPLRMLSDSEKRALVRDRDKNDASFDNRTTYTHVEYLAHAYERTGETETLDALLRGMDYLFAAQYENGGWPHSWPRQDGYRPHITFMDDVMTGILATLRKAAAGEAPFTFLEEHRRQQAAEAVRLGDACILKLQIRVEGVLTAWAGQYDRHTLQPTTARSYELPSIVSAESVRIVQYLMSIDAPSPEIRDAVEGAVRWFERSKLEGIRVERVTIDPIRYDHHTATTDVHVVEDPDAPPLWARFYEIETNRPFFANRDGEKVYTLAEVHHERRTGYGWYTGAPSGLLRRDYPEWKKRIQGE